MFNKYKIVSLVLAIALLAALVQLVALRGTGEAAVSESRKSDIVLENIFSRKSVRSYTDEPVRRSQLDTLLRAAMAAPTGQKVWHHRRGTKSPVTTNAPARIRTAGEAVVKMKAEKGS